MIALIDADILTYRCGFAVQKSITHTDESGEEIGSSLEVEPVSHALQLIKTTIRNILEETEATSHELYLTADDKSNFRFKVAKTKPYKGNRIAPRPVHYAAIREYLVEVCDAKVIHGIEADDKLGIRQVEIYNSLPTTNDEGMSVIVSIDKDLRQIPGLHYNFVTKEFFACNKEGSLELSQDRRKLTGGGHKFFFAQMLLGDNADNIPGVPGYGPVKVYQQLIKRNSFDELARVVYSIYKEEKIQERFLEIADLLWIQQYEDDRISDVLKLSLETFK